MAQRLMNEETVKRIFTIFSPQLLEQMNKEVQALKEDIHNDMDEVEARAGIQSPEMLLLIEARMEASIASMNITNAIQEFNDLNRSLAK